MKQINQYRLHRKLGQGSFAEVFLATDEHVHKDFAAKIFNKSLLRRKRTMNRTAAGVKVTSELDKVEKEIAIMKKLVHRNLVCLFEVIDDDEEDQLYMFIEYVEHGPVMKCDPATRSFTSTVTGAVCEEVVAGQYLLDIASGLRYLHLHHIAHRDLKPDNVLLGHNGHCKIADFGVSHHFAEDVDKKVESLRSLEHSESRAQLKETQGTSGGPASFFSSRNVAARKTGARGASGGRAAPAGTRSGRRRWSRAATRSTRTAATCGRRASATTSSSRARCRSGPTR